MKKVNQTTNELFTPLWEGDARYFILLGGRGAGRSTAATQYILSRLLDKKYFRCAIMREVHSDIRPTVWKELMDRVAEQELEDILDIGESMMNLKYGGNSIQAHGFRQSSGGHSAKLKSLANYNTVLIEEALEVGEHEFMKLDDTLRTVKGDIRIIMNLNPPYKNHWIIKRWFDCLPVDEVEGFYKIKLKDKISDTVYIGGNWKDNMLNLDNQTIRNYQEYKTLDPAYYWQEIEGLVPEVVRGKIYHGWQRVDGIPLQAKLVRFGLDFGWWPSAAAAVAIWYLNGGYIIDQVAYGHYLDNNFLARAIADYQRKHEQEAVVVADAAEPKSINVLKEQKLKVEGSDKGKDAVGYRIKVVSGLKISVTEQSEDIWNDYEIYSMAENKDGESKGYPAHEGSDGMDAVGYGLAGIANPVGYGVKVYNPKFRGYGKPSPSKNKGVKVYIPGVSPKEGVWENVR